jgi:hypothetical protein
MRRFLLTLAITTMISVAECRAQAPGNKPKSPDYALEIGESKRVAAVLTYNVSCPQLSATRWIIFAAVAPELPGQEKATTVLSPDGIAVTEKSLLRRKLLMARVPITNTDLLTAVPIQVSYEATLRSRRLNALPPDAKPMNPPILSPEDRKFYLAEHGQIDFRQAAFKKWLQGEKLVRSSDQDDLEFARRAFLRIRSQMTYEYNAHMDRRASAVCNKGKSDCGGLSVLFVSVMRANGIPARTLYGRWAESAKPDEMLGDEPYYQTHVKAEFFAEGIGWIPIDMSLAVKDDKSEEGLAFFGVDKADFITFHVDPDMSLDTGLFGVEPVDNVQRPAWWAAGRGSPNPFRAAEKWTVKVLK